MIKTFFTALFVIIIAVSAKSQNAVFITLDDAGNLYRVNTSTCSSAPLNLCNNFTGNPLSIALDGNLLYIVDNQGFLYKSTLTNTGTANNCTKIGQFPTITASSTVIVTDYFGLTVGSGGVVYASNGNVIQTYTPSTNTFAKLPGAMPGTTNTDWLTGGDLLFYQGVLYNAVKIVNSGGTTIGNALIKINLTNVSNSTLYMNFNAGTSVFGFASVTVPCSNNQAYALSSNTSTTDIYPVDMITKTQSTTKTCTLPYKVYDAASIAETQSATPPSIPTVVSPVNFCVGQVATGLSATVNSVKDTLKWYTQAVGGISYGSPTPAVSANVVGTTNYYVSAFDTSTGCESARDTIKVIVNAYPAVPTITPSGNNTICSGNSLLLTSSSASSNQWYLDGNILSGAIAQTFSATSNGNYTVVVTGAGGCKKTSAATTLNVTNASINYAGSPFCNTGTATVSLTGNAGGTFTASPAGLSINSTSGAIDLANSALNNYTVTYTVSSANCTYTANIKVEHPTATIQYSAASFCKSMATQSVILTGATGGVYSSSPAGLTIAADGTITPATSAANTYTITYTFGTAGVGCGVQTTSTNVTINTSVNTNINASICAGSSYSFNGNNYNAAGTYTATLVSAAGCDSIVSLHLSVNTPTLSTTNATICKGDTYVFGGTSYNTAGVYTKLLTNANGCDSTATLNLVVEDFKITLTQNPNPVFAGANFTANITGTATIVGSVWQPTGLFTNNQSSQNAVAPGSSFNIKVSATSSNGCKDSTTTPVTVYTSSTVYIPNVFLPNKGGNDNISTLKVYGLTIKTAEMKIFNQWGEMIYQCPNANVKGWDGTGFGKPQTTGPYVYVVKITHQNNTVETRSGTVNLIR